MDLFKTVSGKNITMRVMRPVITAALILFLLLAVGCFNPFAPSLSDGKGTAGLILTEQKSPDDVLVNFSYAYNLKDSLVYSDLLDSSFLFISKNFATDPVTNLTWGRDVDIKTTMGLFRHFESLNLTWQGTVFGYYLGPDSSEYTIKKTFQLTLNGGVDVPTINGEALFYFVMNRRDSTWKISRWEDFSAF